MILNIDFQCWNFRSQCVWGSPAASGKPLQPAFPELPFASQPKHSEENCYITLKNQGNDCVVSIDDCGISSKHIVKASIEANTRILL